MNNNYHYWINGKTKELSQEFIDIFSKKYMDKNDPILEKQICGCISRNHVLTPDEIVSIMRWKTGNKQSTGDIRDCHGHIITSKLGNILVDFMNEKDHTCEEWYRGFLSYNICGLGTVYLLTLVFAASRMDYPIYDRFAWSALYSIHQSKLPGETIKYKHPPDKTSVKSVLKMYEDYQNMLTDVFGDCWKTDRRIDQALWSYGHELNIQYLNI